MGVRCWLPGGGGAHFSAIYKEREKAKEVFLADNCSPRGLFLSNVKTNPEGFVECQHEAIPTGGRRDGVGTFSWTGMQGRVNKGLQMFCLISQGFSV